MKKRDFEPIETVSRLFEMSQVWLHQLRLSGNIRAVCRNQKIFYSIEDVKKWTVEHAEAYRDRKAMGCFDKTSKTTV